MEPKDGVDEHGATSREAVRDVLRRALDLAPEEREAFVTQHLPEGEDAEAALRLLADADDLDGFLEEPPPIVGGEFRPAPLEQLGSYRIRRVLGWGSMGVVYLADQAAPARPVALKVLRLDVTSPTMESRFAREGEVLAKLDHPGIARVYEAGVVELGAGRQPFLAMQYVEGEPITRYADQQGLDSRGRARLLCRVARAVAHAHDQGVLHRDLKPENILVSEDGRPTVLDFGVARSVVRDEDELTLTVTGQVVGTLSYMAPEQARGAKLDARADLFALGAILYELLTGELPFDVRGRLPHEALRIVADGQWRPPTLHDPNLGGDLFAILATALAPEPARRYRSVTAFVDDLDRWLAGDPVAARPPSRLDDLRRFVRRNRSLAAVTVLGSIALGAALAWGAGSARALRHKQDLADLLAAQNTYEQLMTERDELWPVSSDTLPAFDSWLARARELVAEEDEMRAALARLEPERAGARAADSAPGGLRRAASYLDALPRFRVEVLPELEQRRDRAARMHGETVDALQSDWEAVRERVASDPRFGGLRVPPQEGLVPLGPDPDSGLEEFALWGTGVVPDRGVDGHLTPHEEDAILLVLVPGGDLSVGMDFADAEDPDELDSILHWGPPVEVSLDPFLIGKYELTQAQWVRMFGENPSDWEIGSTIQGKTVVGLDPVESLSWETAVLHLSWLGLTLPTEAQWERAARAGTRDACLFGPTWRSLDGLVNWNTHDAPASPEGATPIDDGFVRHCAVGRYPPNAFGLHDVLGNVRELCLDVYKVAYHELEHRVGDGLVLAEPDGDVPVRGLSWASSPEIFSVYRRDMVRTDTVSDTTGVRPCRALVFDGARYPFPPDPARR